MLVRSQSIMLVDRFSKEDGGSKRPKMNSNRYEISRRLQISLRFVVIFFEIEMKTT